jgi:endonuclease YncB( thermonuclease family)
MEVTEQIDFSQHHIDNTPHFTLAGLSSWARVVDVYDGDTLTCIVPLLERFYQITFRLNGIDTNELKNKNEQLKKQAYLARHQVLVYMCPEYNLLPECERKDIQQFLKQNQIVVWLKCYEHDKYGRVMADVFSSPNSESLTDLLLNQGLGYEYHGGTKKKSNNQ